MNTFELSRNWFDFCFENPEKITPSHTAIYFFAIEHCNRLGGKEKFGFPSQMTMEAIGIMKHQTYIRYFNDIVEWGFFKLIEKSRNQYSSNIISLVYAMPKNGKALGKATVKHRAKQGNSTGQSTGQSKDSIIKQETINHKPETIKCTNVQPPFNSQEFTEVWNKFLQCPKQRKKPPSAIELISKKLKNYDEKFSIELLENAISGNYQGVIFADTNEKYERYKRKTNGTVRGLTATYDRGATFD